MERRRRWERLLLDFEAQEKFRRQLSEDIERTKAYACGVEVNNPRNPGARRKARKVAKKAVSRERRLTALEFFRSQVAMYVDEADAVLGGFLLDEFDCARTLSELSVGQVRRLLIAILVNRPSRLLVLDEPTNHLDFDSLDVVEAALSDYRGALLVVTHDEEFARRIGLNQRWTISAGRLESAA